MKRNERQIRGKKIGGLLPALSHFGVVMAFLCGSYYLLFFSGLVKMGPFLSLIGGLGVLGFLQFINFISCGEKEGGGALVFIVMHSITVVLPVIIYIIIHTIKLAKGGMATNSFFVITVRVLLLDIFCGLFEENLRKVFYNMVFAKYHVKHCSFLWISLMAILLSFGGHLAGCRVIFGVFPNLRIMAFIGVFEIYLTILYLRGSVGAENRMDVETSGTARFFLLLLLYSQVIFFRDVGLEAISLPTPILYLSAIVVTILVIYVIAKRKELDICFYNSLKKWNIPKERLYNGHDFLKKKTVFRLKKKDINIYTYLFISILSFAAMFAIHFILHFFGIAPENCTIDIVRDNGLDLILTLISSTFLIVSFLSFLGDKDDKVLWTDMRSYRLINPALFNFIGLSVFSFASLAAETVCYVLKYDYLFLVSFFAGMFFLIYLTFLVIVSYFRREETIEKLSEYSISTLFDPEDDFSNWNLISDELYENAAKMIEDKNWSKLQEIYDYLIAMINGIRNAQIREWLKTKGYISDVRADDIYANSFYSCTLRYDCGEHPLFTIVQINDQDSKTEFALFNYQLVLDELERILSLLDYRSLKLLINRNKQSTVVLQLVEPSIIVGITDESGENLVDQIRSISTAMIQQDCDLLQKECGTRKFTLKLSIGTMIFDFSTRKKQNVIQNEKQSIQKYMMELADNNYKNIIPKQYKM